MLSLLVGGVNDDESASQTKRGHSRQDAKTAKPALKEGQQSGRRRMEQSTLHPILLGDLGVLAATTGLSSVKNAR
jgi:hypothetical protein